MVVKDEGGPDRVQTRQTGALLTCLKNCEKIAAPTAFVLAGHWRACPYRAKRRIPITSSRCRQRQQRAETKSVIEALTLGGLERALNFDARRTVRQIPGSARLFAAQAAGLACREDPLEFKGDKRGRSRQVFDSILEGVWSGSDDSNSSDGCAGVDGGGPPRRVEA